MSELVVRLLLLGEGSAQAVVQLREEISPDLIDPGISNLIVARRPWLVVLLDFLVGVD